MDGAKTILISGATSGIGRAAALQLAQAGQRVVLVGRSAEKCRATAAEIQQATGQEADWLLADLSRQADVRQLAGEVLARYPRLDGLINNAGAVYMRRELSADGLEMGWAVNYLQAFLLTRLLLERLEASAPARIVNLSSIYHWTARLNLDRLDERGLYIGWEVYARTKLAMLYFSYELARRLEGKGVTVNAIHPGFVATGMGKNSGWLLRAVFGLVDLFSIPAQEGARGVARLALDPALDGLSGLYFSQMKQVRSSPVSYDRATAARLWDWSLERTGLKDQGFNVNEGARASSPL